MSDIASHTFYDLYRQQAAAQGDAIAIQAPNAADLSYSGLVGQMDTVIDALSTWGIGRGDVVVVQLPNGPVPLVLMQGIATLAVVMLMDPRSGDPEAESLLRFVQPKALIAQQGIECSGRAAAMLLGVRVIEIIPTPDTGAGTFVFAESIPRLGRAAAVEWP